MFLVPLSNERIRTEELYGCVQADGHEAYCLPGCLQFEFLYNNNNVCGYNEHWYPKIKYIYPSRGKGEGIMRKKKSKAHISDVIHIKLYNYFYSFHLEVVAIYIKN